MYFTFFFDINHVEIVIEETFYHEVLRGTYCIAILSYLFFFLNINLKS